MSILTSFYYFKMMNTGNTRSKENITRHSKKFVNRRTPLLDKTNREMPNKNDGTRRSARIKKKINATNNNKNILTKNKTVQKISTKKVIRESALTALQEIVINDPKLLYNTSVSLDNSQVENYLKASAKKKYLFRRRDAQCKYEESLNEQSIEEPSKKTKRKLDVYDFECSDEERVNKKKRYDSECSDDSLRYVYEYFKRQERKNKHKITKPRKKKIDKTEKTSTIKIPEIVIQQIEEPTETAEVINNIEDDNVSDHSDNIDNIVQSFIEDTEKTTSPQIISKNLTTSLLDQSNPWRLNFICKNVHTFSVKPTSFTPNYDQEIVINSSMIKPMAEADTEIQLPKPKHQSTMLDFVSSSRTVEKSDEQIGLFEDKPATPRKTPRKILGALNCDHSTPMNPRQPQKPASLHRSAFGFSTISEDEELDFSNIENQLPPAKKKGSPKKNKPTRILFEEIRTLKQPTKVVDEPVAVEVADVDTNSTQDDENFNVSVGLFQDFEENLHVSKKTRNSYERKRPKRVRLPSTESYHSDDEAPDSPSKKKKKYVRTKKEEEEAEKLASLYNSMFQEIEEHSLCIE